MRTIVQLSDLHFGSILEPTLEPLLATVRSLNPNVVIVSGDLTQRARPEQFEQARAYLDRLPKPLLVIPGNHDIPFYDVFSRFATPLHHYRKYIGSNLAPSYVDDEIAIAGIHSARSFTFKGGTLGADDVAVAAKAFEGLNDAIVKIVFTHHPFDIPVALSGVQVVRGVHHAVEKLARVGVDLFLAGHLHLVHQAKASMYVPASNATILQAGTATSNRARGESNSFFAIRTHEGALDVDVYYWNPATNQFEMRETRAMTRNAAVHTG